MPWLSGGSIKTSIMTSIKTSIYWKKEKVQEWAARYVTNNCMDRSLLSVTSMLGNLKWSSLEQWKWQTCLGMLYKININPASFFHLSDSKTRGAQRLHQEHAQHLVLFHSFFLHTVSEQNLLTTAISSAPSLKSFPTWLGCNLHNLQPVPTSRWTSRRSCI